MGNKNDQVFEIDILQLAKALLKKWWLIIISAVVCGALALAYSMVFITPQYSASVLFYSNNKSISLGSTSLSISGGDISTSRTLVDTYCVILKTRLTLESVAEALKDQGLSYSYGQLNGMISYATVNSTEIFRVTIMDSNPENACTIANTIAQILPEKISDVVEGSSVNIVDYAVVPTARTSPSYSSNATKGALIGAVLACAFIAVEYLINDTIDTETWLLNTYKEEIPLLAVIPNDNVAGNQKYKKYGYKTNYYKTYGFYTSELNIDEKSVEGE